MRETGSTTVDWLRQLRAVHPAPATLLAICVPCLAAGPASGQSLNVATDVSIGTGLSRGVGDGEGISARTPVFAHLDVGFIFDRDFSSEWGAGMTFQLEGQTAFAVTPQVRLVRGETPMRFYVGVGVPAYLTPFTLFGGEVAGGLIYSVNEVLGFVAGLKVDAFVAGSDLPEGAALVMFNLGAGGRVLF